MNGLFNAYFYLDLLKIRRYIYDPDRKTAGIEYPYAIEVFVKTQLPLELLRLFLPTSCPKKSKICLKQEKKLKDERYVSLCHLILN